MPGIVASGHPETSRASALALEAGGNAFDAAVAGLLMACVAEPLLASLGGGGFLLAESASGERLVFDFFGQTPLRKDPDARFFEIEADFGPTIQEFHIGPGSAAVPGIVSGLFAVHARLGSVPLRVLAEPAIRAARDGVEVNRFQAYVAHVLTPILTASEPLRAVYTDPGGIVTTGSLHRQPRLAATLEWLVEEGPEGFYRGPIAEQIVELCADHGGHLQPGDLAAYRTELRAPLEFRYRDNGILTNPVPSCGGSLIALSVSLMDRLRAAGWQSGTAAYACDLARVFQTTQVERARTAFQANPLPELVAELLADGHLATLVETLSERRLATRGTTHLSVADAQGNLAATTVSNGEGCGWLIGETGVQLNNLLGEEDLSPNGVGNWTEGRRLSSMMAPTIVDQPDGRRIALGSGGSNRIRSAIVQVILQILEFDLDLETAVRAPRLHFDAGRVSIEPGWSAEVYAELGRAFDDLHRWDGTNLFFGGVHAVSVDASGRNFDATGDPRRGGAVARTNT